MLDFPTGIVACLPPFAKTLFSLRPQASLALASRGHASTLLRSGSPKQRQTADLPRQPHEWLLNELALELGMPSVTLFSWIQKGWVRARQIEHSARKLWLVWADTPECDRLRARRGEPRRWSRHIRVGDATPSAHPS